MVCGALRAWFVAIELHVWLSVWSTLLACPWKGCFYSTRLSLYKDTIDYLYLLTMVTIDQTISFISSDSGYWCGRSLLAHPSYRKGIFGCFRLSERRRLIHSLFRYQSAIVLSNRILNFLSKGEWCWLAVMTAELWSSFTAQLVSWTCSKLSASSRSTTPLTLALHWALTQMTSIALNKAIMLIVRKVLLVLHPIARLSTSLLHVSSHLLEKKGRLMQWFDWTMAEYCLCQALFVIF